MPNCFHAFCVFVFLACKAEKRHRQSGQRNGWGLERALAGRAMDKDHHDNKNESIGVGTRWYV